MGAFTEPDPAERSAFNRFFYRNRRPTWLGHWVSQFFCWWARAGLPPEERAPVLQEYVRVASSGRKHFPLPVGAPLADFAAIAAQYPVYRIDVPAT